MRPARSSVFVVPRTYAELRRCVEQVIVAGRRKVDLAWLLTYHETGRLIVEHLLLKQERADYGAKVFTQLAADTTWSRRLFYQCAQFYRCFPIVQISAQLEWSHYQLLCQVADPKQRTALLAQAVKQDWNVAALETRVRTLNAAIDIAAADTGAGDSKSAVKILKPRRGTLDRYRVVARDDGPAIDVGFKLYRPLSGAEARGLKTGAIVGFAGEKIAPAKDAVAADLFTYRVKIRRAIDGDTLAVTIALPHYAMDEKLRLRGLDCPEMDTPEGRAAKRFTESLLVDATEVIIATSKVDKYDRYLADVHVLRPSGEEIFLNNALLENGHAVLLGHEEMTDWTP